MESKPTHEQAQLHLQVYDLRREARLREARDWFLKNFHADNIDEAMRIAAPMTQGGTNFMMVVSYWEQACALLNYGLLHDDLFFETSGEFFGVWERIKPTIAEGREQWANQQFLAKAPGHVVEGLRRRVEELRVLDAKNKAALDGLK